jgi:DNA-binding NarL/FixJ family response regulator
MGPFTLLLVDDDVELLHLLRRCLAHDGFQVITAEDGEQALRVLDHHPPNLVIVDLLLGDVDSLRLVEQIKRWGDVPVIFLTRIHGVRVRARDVQRCAEDYVVKPFEYEELLDRIRRVLDRPSGTTTRESAMDTEVRLTERQLEVLQLAASGATNNEIAMRLTISAQTVSWHISRICTRLGARSRVQAVALALQRGLLEPIG